MDLSQLCNINVRVEEQVEEIDTSERTARNTETIIYIIEFFTIFFVRDMFLTLFILLLCIESLYILNKRPRNYQKTQKAILELCFNDQIKASVKVDREERESLFSILEKNKHSPSQIIKKSICLGSLTQSQKDTARARYWQLPVAGLFLFAISMKAMLSFLEYSHKMSEINTIPRISSIEELYNTVMSVLSHTYIVAFVIITCIWIGGEIRRNKLSKHDV